MSEDFDRVLNVSPEDACWQVVCTQVGTRTVGGAIACERQTGIGGGAMPADEYRVIYISDGGGVFNVDGRRCEVRTGTVLLLFPGDAFCGVPDADRGWTAWWIGFKGAWADGLRQCGVISPALPLFHVGYQHTLTSGFQAIIELARNQAPLYQFKAGGEVMRLLAETLSLARQQAPATRTHDIVERVKSFIESHVGDAFDLQALETAIALQAPQLNKIFKSVTGTTPYQYSIRLKINRAKSLLCMSTLSMKEVAWTVGFNDPYYFSRLFKKRTGFSPTQWAGQS